MYIYKKFTKYICEVKILERLKLNRSKIRVYLYIFFIFLAMFIGLVLSSVKADRLSNQMTAASQRSLVELEEYISAINTSLIKGKHAGTSALLGDVANDLIRDASSAKIAVAALPISDTRLDNTTRFLSQVGSFVSALNKKLASGETISLQERKQLQTLIDYSQKLSEELLKINEDIESGMLSFSDSQSTLQKSDMEIKSLTTAMNDISQAAGDYPTLIYDGPFSDHILQQKPKLLEGKRTLTKDEARKKAADFLSTDVNSVNFAGEQEGDIPSYVFTKKDLTLAVTKIGGYAVYMLGSEFAGEAKLSAEDAIERASQFLTSKGFQNMKDSYYYINDGICTVNFAYFKGDIIYYSDLIKVSINLENGNIISFDARGYIMNHSQRNLKSPSISSEEAKKSISSELNAVSSRLAVIPTDFASEELCYEFHCKNSEGKEFLVYIDTETGEENDILILLYSDNGILTK